MLKTSDYDEPFEVFYDGGCRLCVTEINLLRRLDRRQRIIFTDIGNPKFSAVDETGLSYVELMVRIHGRYANGQLVEGVEVFRQLYARTLFRPLVPLSRIPGLRALLDRCYVFFAQWRFKSRGGACAPDGTCRIELPDTAQP